VLALAGPRARREAKSLVLVLDGGKTLRLSDGKCAASDEPCPRYSLAAFLPSHGVFVVRKDEVEAYDYVLVDMSDGHRHVVDGPPHYSPDGKRFITCRVDEMNGGGSTIWRVASGRYVQEWQDQRMSVCGGWKDDDTAAAGIYDDVPGGKPRPAMIARKGGAWQLREEADVLKARP